jgi:hypothetical protein
MPVQLPDAMIRDTVAAVFSDPAYRRSTLLQRMGAWLLDQIGAFFARLEAVRMSPVLFWALVVLTGLVLMAVLTRWFYLRRLARRVRAQGIFLAGAPGDRAVDAWSIARQLAARAEYTAAAHALYAGILGALAGRGEVELHESKTCGDYVRDLGLRSSAVRSRFRDFTRSYEVVIYGLGFCDRERYERLLGLAHYIVEPRG